MNMSVRMIRPLVPTATSFGSAARTTAATSTLSVLARRLNSSKASSPPEVVKRGKFVAPEPPQGHKGNGLRVSTLFGLLVAVGVTATGYGIWLYYSSFQTWPPELRDDLRAAIKLRDVGEIKKAEHKFRSALLTGQSLPPELLAPSPLLKLTGISIALAAMLEDSGQLDKAYTAYKEAFESCLVSEGSAVGRSGKERARAVAISQKLGHIALKIAAVGPERSSGSENLSTAVERALKALPIGDAEVDVAPPPLLTKRAAEEAAERHMVWTVEELLRLSVPEEIQKAASITSASSKPGAAAAVSTEEAEVDSVWLADLNLPPWVSQSDLLGSIESLGSYYAREGRTEYAVPLYLQALEILVPTSAKSKKPQESITVSDRCRAAVVMNNLSQVFLEGQRPSDAEFVKATAAAGGKEQQALAWAKKGLSLVQSTNAKVGWGLDKAGEGGNTIGKAKEVVASDDEARTEEVRRECIRAEVTLLVNLGSLSQLAKDDCAARNYLQRAYRLADQEGMREARNRAASILSRLERFKKPTK